MRHPCRQHRATHLGARLLCLAAALLLCCAALPLPARAADASSRRVVRVGYYIAPGFQDYDEASGTYSGSGYEYLTALQQYTDWTYEFVPVAFSDGVRLLSEGKLDLMNNVSITPERQETLAFSDYAAGSNYGCLIVDADNDRYAFNDYAAFDAMRIGVVAGSIFLPYFEQLCADHQISPTIVPYATEPEMRDGLDRGEIDARIVSSSYRDGSREVAHFASMNYYFAVPIAQQALLRELNDAMAALQVDLPDLAHDLLKKYETRVVDKVPVLSSSEKSYVETHPVVTVAISGAWYPIFYIDQSGALCGPLATIYRAISQATGLTLQPVQYPSYSASLEAVQSGEVDTIVEFPYDFLYASKWDVQLAEKIYGLETYCIMNESMRTDEIRTIAFHGEPYMESRIEQQFGAGATYVRYDTVDAAVEAVLSGEVDATFVNYYTSTKFQNQGRYLSLKYVLIPSLQYDFSIGVSHAADPCLKSLLSKGLHTLDDDTIEDLFRQAALSSSSPDVLLQFYRNPTAFLLVAVIATALLVLILAFVLYSRRMRRSNEKLASANQAKSRFLSQMSHDMRTPMNGILGLVTLMQDMDASPEIKQDLRQIQMSGKYLLNLINDTLDMSKIEANRLELHPAPTDAAKVVESIRSNAQLLAAEKGVTFVLERLQPEVNLPAVMLDEGRVQQLFMNLISNAVKFTPAGGQVRVTIQRLETTEDFILDRYQVMDTGIGMSEAFMAHMFEPFSQEGRAETDRENGTGLGLSIVHTLVKQMGGELRVQSTVNVGSTFTVTLRFQRYHGTLPEDAARTTFACLSGKRVLLCEDHPLNRQIAVKMLEKQGIAVDTAENGQVGCELFESAAEGTYDLILMDICMPVMDGLTATRRIRQLLRADAATIPIVAMTANAYDEDIRQCLDAGMNAHVAKPVDVQRLYQVLAEQMKA